jgi:SAM-dependent methyltransferase
MDEAAAANHELWEREVRAGCGFCVPWLDLDREAPLASAPEHYPPEIFAGVAGQRVLCLAAGGGQQSAVFGLLGADVTVVDFVEGQLEADRIAARHYGYEVATLRSDMRDLSALGKESFDLVFQAESMAYVPDCASVFAEVARVLRPGGTYRVEFLQPAAFAVEWDGEGYRVARPYGERTHEREDVGIETRHTLADIFNGLMRAGFEIESVHERPRTAGSDSEPGTWAHQERYVGGGFAVVARWPDRPDNPFCLYSPLRVCPNSDRSPWRRRGR